MKSVFHIATGLALTAFIAAPLASAHIVPADGQAYDAPAPQTDSSKQASPNITLPSQDEIEAIKEQMPDMTALLGDMMGLMHEESFKNGVMGSLETFKQHIDPETLGKTKDGVPDMTAMMGSMLDLLGDEAFVGGLVDQLDPIKELVEKHAPTPKPAEPEWQ